MSQPSFIQRRTVLVDGGLPFSHRPMSCGHVAGVLMRGICERSTRAIFLMSSFIVRCGAGGCGGGLKINDASKDLTDGRGRAWINTQLVHDDLSHAGECDRVLFDGTFQGSYAGAGALYA